MKNESLGSFPLSRRDITVLKGFAIIAMLFFHIYGYPPNEVDPYTIPEWIHVIGNLGKVCVAIFVFCSGYGLAVSYKGNGQTGSFGVRLKYNLRFLARRLAKFYANYWFVFLIFVPITIFCFGKTASFNRLFVDWWGIGGFKSFNITWWFNALIISLYALFPLFYAGCRKCLPIMLAICLAGYFLYEYVQLIILSDILSYSFPFVLGILWAQRPGWLSKFGYSLLSPGWRVVVSLLFFGVFVALRPRAFVPWFSGVKVDGFISVSLAVVLVSMRSLSLGRLWDVLAFFGRHSANIYLIHTFFNDMWRPVAKWIHGAFHGCWNFVVLFAICLLVSIVIEWVKKVTRYNLLTEKVVANISKAGW